MAASDLPDEAVEAAARALMNFTPPQKLKLRDVYTLARVALAAAAPHIRAQVLAEVDAALRAMTPGMPDPCQPIGCDNGFHLPGCAYIRVDNPDWAAANPDDTAPAGAPDEGADDARP